MYKTCPVCGNIFNKGIGDFCSRACVNKSRTNPSKRSVFTCQWCNTNFEDWTYRQPKFCSNQCRSEYGAQQPRPSKQKPETMKVDRVCEICGEHFTSNIYQITLRGGGKYCSRACKYKARIEQFSGENNPNYKGGVTKDKQYFRGNNWDRQRRQAIKRDNRECQVCGSRGNVFNRVGVHHIKPYRLFDGDFESANQLSNLITLCRTHHGLIESGKMPCPKPKS